MILVTGSQGFIGRSLVQSLKLDGQEVLGFDTKYHQVKNALKIINLSKISQIYHLGAISSTLETNIDALYEHNVRFSIDLFEAAKEYNIPVVYTSSASVFGNTMKSEQYIHNPLNYYATTKMWVEQWIGNNINTFNRLTTLRLYNVYGNDEQKSDMSTSPICKFRQQAKDTGTITLFKDSHNMIRDFICVEDVVHQLKYYMENKRSGTFDVGTGMPISFQSVAEMVADKYNATIRYIDMPRDMKNAYQYYTKARSNVFMTKTVEDWLFLN